MRTRVIQFGVDKLKLCCTQDGDWLIQKIMDAYQSYDEQHSGLHATSRARQLSIPLSDDVILAVNVEKEFLDRYKLKGSVSLLYNGETTTFIDEIEIHAHKKGDNFKDSAFVTMSNRWLYIKGWASHLSRVMELLRLHYHNITLMEVHCTSVNINFVDKITKKRKEDGIIMVALDRAYRGKEKVLALGKWLRQTAIGSDLSYPTYYISTAKRDLAAKAYNKTIEMEEQSPEKIEYVREWLHGYKGTYHRLEVSLSKERTKTLLKKASYEKEQLRPLLESNNIVRELENNELLQYLWKTSLNALMHFKKGSKPQDWLRDVIHIDERHILTP